MCLNSMHDFVFFQFARFYTTGLPMTVAINGHAPAGGTIVPVTADYRYKILQNPSLLCFLNVNAKKTPENKRNSFESPSLFLMSVFHAEQCGVDRRSKWDYRRPGWGSSRPSGSNTTSERSWTAGGERSTPSSRGSCSTARSVLKRAWWIVSSTPKKKPWRSAEKFWVTFIQCAVVGRLVESCFVFSWVEPSHFGLPGRGQTSVPAARHRQVPARPAEGPGGKRQSSIDEGSTERTGKVFRKTL